MCGLIFLWYKNPYQVQGPSPLAKTEAVPNSDIASLVLKTTRLQLDHIQDLTVTVLLCLSNRKTDYFQNQAHLSHFDQHPPVIKPVFQ